MSLPPSRPNGSSADPRVVVFAREGCHLCEEAERIVAQVCDALGEAYEVVDIDEDEDRADAARVHPDEIPVTFVDGRQHDFWRVDPGRLRAALTGPGVGGTHG